MNIRRWAKRVALGGAIVFVVIQAVPYGRAHTNPTTRAEPPWTTPRVRDLARRACFDCHSNETVWPWYSHVAPASWLVQRDVDRGRAHLNYSEWGQSQKHADDAAEEVAQGEMPPWAYLPTHPDARLSDAEKSELIAGFRAMFPNGRQGERRGDGDHDED